MTSIDAGYSLQGCLLELAGIMKTKFDPRTLETAAQERGRHGEEQCASSVANSPGGPSPAPAAPAVDAVDAAVAAAQAAAVAVAGYVVPGAAAGIPPPPPPPPPPLPYPLPWWWWDWWMLNK